MRWLRNLLGIRDLRIVVWHPKNTQAFWHVRVVCPENGKIMLSSETYATHANATHAAHALSEMTGWEIVHAGPGVEADPK